MKVVAQIARVDAREGFAEVIASGQPAILTHATDAWAAPSKWTREWLKEHIGAKRVSADSLLGRQQMTLAEYIDHVFTSATELVRWRASHRELKITRGHEPDPDLGGLLADIAIPDVIPPEQLSSVQYWLSSGPHVNQLHYDANGCHNLNAQITGEKQVFLFAPDEIRRMYMKSLFEAPNPAMDLTGSPCGSVPDPNGEHFPLFRDAPCIEGTIAAGEMLFIPAFWAHLFFHGRDINQNVNFWWNTKTVELNPTTLSWALTNLVVNAVLRDNPTAALPDVAAVVEAFPPEVKALLRKLDFEAKQPEASDLRDWLKKRTRPA